MKRLLGGLGAVLPVVLAVLVVRAARSGAPPADGTSSGSASAPAIDPAGAAARLAGAIELPVGGLSLVYTWTGSEPTLSPIVLMGHLDVVPVPEANRAKWTHGPFS